MVKTKDGFAGLDLEDLSSAYVYDPASWVTERMRVTAAEAGVSATNFSVGAIFGGMVSGLSFGGLTAPTSVPSSGFSFFGQPPPSLPGCDEPDCSQISALGGIGKCFRHDPGGFQAAYERELHIRKVNGW